MMKNKLLMILFLGLICGKANALPQDWPCDNFVLYPVKQVDKDAYDFKGVIRDYEVSLDDTDPLNLSSYCGNAGCWGSIKNLKTGQEESLYFNCDHDEEQNTLKCRVNSGDEYLFTKFSENEYRAELCEGTDYVYFKRDECKGCTCIIQDVHPDRESDWNWDMNCVGENGKIRCFRYYGYEDWRKSITNYDDYANCVDLGGF